MFDLSGVSLNDVLESMSEYEAGSVVRACERGRAPKHLPQKHRHVNVSNVIISLNV